MKATTVLLPMLIGATTGAAMAAAPPGPDPGVVVLDTGSPWRCHMTWKTEMVRTAAGLLQPVALQRGSPVAVTRTALPPPDWAEPEFDDRAWPRFHGPIPEGSRSLALICLRGKFEVTDPAAVGDLTLSLTYRGGAVVYLNGKEVARGHLPHGKPDLQAFAEDYPAEAYIGPDGYLLRHGFGEPQKYKDRFAVRARRLVGVKVSAALLRAGVNVLAVELHRAPTSEVFVKGRAKGGMERFYCPWSMLLFKELRLTAPAGAAPVPNTVAAKGLRVWTASPVRWVRAAEYADPNEHPSPVTIVGCRNGSFSGQLVVGSTETIGGLKVEAGPLRAAASGAVIPAGAVQVRYVRPNLSLSGQRPALDALEETAPHAVPAVRGGAVQPLWITVRVPREARLGDYAGALTISADGARSVEVPVRLKVAGWALPDPQRFESHVGLIQSPDSVALKYGVPLWSEEHWKLLDRTFALLGQVGTDDVYIPLICDTYHGNQQTMVRWIRRDVAQPPSAGGAQSQPTQSGAAGQHTHDFSIAERYLDLAVRHLGRPPVVCLYVWHDQGGFWAPTSKHLGKQKEPARVTRFDPSTGKVDRMDAPMWGTPASVPFWRPVIDGMRERLKARGLEGLMVGVALDSRPLEATVADLKAAAPDAKWVLHSHMGAGGAIKQDIIGYGAHVWISYRLWDPAARPNKVWWQNPYIFTGFPRSGVGGVASLKYSCPQDPAVPYRVLVEGLMAAGHNGFGRVGADFWPCRKDKRGRLSPIFGRASVTLNDSNPAVLAPGINGPISTVRFEMLREGVQEAEARIFIEKAIADPALKARLGGELAGRCRALLDDRARNLLRYAGYSTTHQGNRADWPLFRALPWQQDSETLYAAAAEVAGRLGGRQSPR